jgi:hypothetical protein
MTKAQLIIHMVEAISATPADVMSDVEDQYRLVNTKGWSYNQNSLAAPGRYRSSGKQPAGHGSGSGESE